LIFAGLKKNSKRKSVALMKKLALLMFVPLVLSGCAVTETYGVIPFGPDTYRLRGTDTKNYKADNLVIDEATKYCESFNKHFMPVQGSGRGGVYTLIFSCLDEDDPALKRPPKGAE